MKRSMLAEAKSSLSASHKSVSVVQTHLRTTKKRMLNHPKSEIVGHKTLTLEFRGLNSSFSLTVSAHSPRLGPLISEHTRRSFTSHSRDQILVQWYIFIASAVYLASLLRQAISVFCLALPVSSTLSPSLLQSNSGATRFFSFTNRQRFKERFNIIADDTST